ncbi:MAG TPA: DUF1360 domain-containing protein [Actinomycetota bacterium]|nr:DUF1360 domain-containing protein [Actinomycetota bacterium]
MTGGLVERAQQAWAGYSPHEHKPLATYAGISSVFAAALGAALLAAARAGRLPERVGAGDIVLVGVATQKLSRLATKGKVTSWIRAPFTEYEEPGAPAEVNERPRGTGVQAAVGELLACPFCLAQWLTAGFTCGLMFAPRLTRSVASIYVAQTISDFLQFGYSAAESAESRA